MAAAKIESFPRGTETILLVEPDPEYRTLAAFMLSRLGYHVLEARNAMEAVKLYDERGGGIDLLLAEIRMPRVDGQALTEVLSARDSSMRLLYLGDPDYNRGPRRVAAPKYLPLLPRPFTMQVLAGCVRSALDHPCQNPRVLAAGSSA